MATLSVANLIARWGELCGDASLRDLPYKVELNACGKLEMSPLTNRRGLLMGQISSDLHSQLKGGIVLMSCGVLTRSGIWGLFERAPEICVEVCAPDGEEKVDPFLVAGAREVWLVSEEGSIRYFDRSGEQKQSSFPASVSMRMQ